MVGAMVGRKTWVDRDLHKTFPMLNLLLLGPSGIGKSAAIKTGLTLLNGSLGNDVPTLIEDSTTLEALHVELVEHPNAILFAEELATFFGKQKYMEGMIPYMTNLLDYKTSVSRRLKSEGVTVIEAPAATFLGGSTLEWLQTEIPNTAVAGGFLPRFLLIKEDAKQRKVAHPLKALDRRARIRLETLRDKVFAEFVEIVHNAHSGPMDFHNYDVADQFGEWYLAKRPESELLSPFTARASMWVLRLALLMALCRQAGSINEDDLSAAIALYEYTEVKLAEALQHFTPRGKLLAVVLQAVSFEPMTQTRLFRNLRSTATSKEIREFLQSLAESGDVELLADQRVRRIK